MMILLCNLVILNYAHGSLFVELTHDRQGVTT